MDSIKNLNDNKFCKMIENENNINENKEKQEKIELANDVAKDEVRISNELKDSNKEFKTGGWTGGLFRIAHLANKI
ncbi:MAG: hypothetical protein ACP5O4_01970 [bacterium]